MPLTNDLNPTGKIYLHTEFQKNKVMCKKDYLNKNIIYLHTRFANNHFQSEGTCQMPKSQTEDSQSLINPDELTTLERKEASILSPLRYPGAKRRFAGYVAETLRINRLRPKLFVEPFAGGASVALQLLNDDLVEKVGLGELDPLVASFWECVFFDTEWLIEQIENIEVSIEKWHHYKTTKATTARERGLTCLFLNRTSYSGIITEAAGPIGGKKQVSEYKIDCRFTRATLIKRVEQAAKLKDRIEFIRNWGWQDTIKYCTSLPLKDNEVFIYLDPPFYHKASELYRLYFQDSDHRQLHDTLIGTFQYWLLSYDAADEVRDLYSEEKYAPKCVELLYTASPAKSQLPVKELVITNLPSVPQHNKLWRKSAEWNQSANSTLFSQLDMENTIETGEVDVQ